MSRADDPIHPGMVTNGLTIREHAAIEAMKGLLSKHGDDDYTEEAIARKARKYADALLAELAKDKS